MSINDSGDCGLSWRKASRSAANGECVEVASAMGRISVRDSKDPEGPVLTYPADVFRLFLHTARKSTSLSSELSGKLEGRPRLRQGLDTKPCDCRAAYFYRGI
jgi:hypothetical protein